MPPGKAVAIVLFLAVPGPLRSASAQDRPGPPAAATGLIRGTVRDREVGTPVALARASLLGHPHSAISSIDGTFLMRDVPAGSHTLIVAKDGYDRLLLEDTVVAPGRMTEVDADLAAEVFEIEELVVVGTDPLVDSEVGMLDLRATAVSLQDAVSSELIGKAGASDVAGALKLVVGASVVGGKYATVRGLSDRYTGTTLNGVRVPSADPRRRAVQLDLFPTGTLESVTVTKSFMPDMQGDFTGGGVDIRTRSIPDGKVMTLTTALEYNTLTTGSTGYLSYGGGGVGTFAHDDSRALPEGSTEPLPALPRFSTRPTQEQMAASLEYDGLVRSFDPVMGVGTDEAPLNSGFAVVAGDRYEFGDARVLGVMSALSYTRKFDSYEDGINNNGGVSDENQAITIDKPRADTRGQEEALIGGLANFVLRPNDDHELSLRVVANQSAEDEARFQVQDTGEASIEQNQSLHYTERSLVSFQLHGDHTLAGDRRPRFEWLAASNRTSQDEPDVRFFRNTFDGTTLSGTMPAGTAHQNTRRIFRTIEEENKQAGVHATIPFAAPGGLRGFVKAGLFADRTDRVYGQNSFFYSFATPQVGYPTNADAVENQSYSVFQATSPDQLWTDVFLDPQRIGLAGNTPPAPNQLLWVIEPFGDDVDYDGEQSIGAVYGMGELPLRHDLKVIGGVRRETTALTVVPTNRLFGVVDVIEIQESGDRAIVTVDQDEAVADIDGAVLLPALSAVWEPAARMNVRLSWARTLARPTFRELAPVATEEFIFGDEYIGNPDLVLSRITNYDLRWEWFRRTGDVLAASLFYKELTDPIEYISFAVSDRSFVQPVNYERGTVRGLEVEARLALDLISERLRNLSVGVNATWIDSEVEVPAAERESLAPFGLDEKTRRLQGQPEHVYNFNVVWDDEVRGWSAGLFYNRVGETLLTGAARGVADGIPNVYDQAYSTIDLTFGKRLTELLSIGFKARNLQQPDRSSIYRRPNGEEAVKTERGTAALFAASATFKW